MKDDIRKRKAGLIQEINTMLSSGIRGNCLTVEEFDILYSMDLDELIDAKFEVERQHAKALKPSTQHS